MARPGSGPSAKHVSYKNERNLPHIKKNIDESIKNQGSSIKHQTKTRENVKNHKASF